MKVPFYRSEHVGPLDVVIISKPEPYMLIGKDVDLDELIFAINLTDDDRDFLKYVKVKV